MKDLSVLTVRKAYLVYSGVNHEVVQLRVSYTYGDVPTASLVMGVGSVIRTGSLAPTPETTCIYSIGEAAELFIEIDGDYPGAQAGPVLLFSGFVASISTSTERGLRDAASRYTLELRHITTSIDGAASGSYFLNTQTTLGISNQSFAAQLKKYAGGGPTISSTGGRVVDLATGIDLSESVLKAVGELIENPGNNTFVTTTKAAFDKLIHPYPAPFATTFAKGAVAIQSTQSALTEFVNTHASRTILQGLQALAGSSWLYLVYFNAGAYLAPVFNLAKAGGTVLTADDYTTIGISVTRGVTPPDGVVLASLFQPNSTLPFQYPTPIKTGAFVAIAIPPRWVTSVMLNQQAPHANPRAASTESKPVGLKNASTMALSLEPSPTLIKSEPPAPEDSITFGTAIAKLMFASAMLADQDGLRLDMPWRTDLMPGEVVDIRTSTAISQTLPGAAEGGMIRGMIAGVVYEAKIGVISGSSLGVTTSIVNLRAPDDTVRNVEPHPLYAKTFGGCKLDGTFKNV